jgi:hypothetical protein
MLYTLRVLRTAPPVHSASRVLLTPILSLPRRVGSVGNAIHVCYTQRFALRASRSACYRIVQHTIHMHTYRIVSYNILSGAHACRHYGTESHAHTNIYTSILIPQPYTYTHTEKVNPFFIIRNQVGGWAKPKPFPLRGYGFKMGI